MKLDAHQNYLTEKYIYKQYNYFLRLFFFRSLIFRKKSNNLKKKNFYFPGRFRCSPRVWDFPFLIFPFFLRHVISTNRESRWGKFKNFPKEKSLRRSDAISSEYKYTVSLGKSKNVVFVIRQTNCVSFFYYYFFIIFSILIHGHRNTRMTICLGC